jgi:hypothetical protein
MMSGQTLDAATIEPDQNRVHAVEAGAGHQPGEIFDGLASH